MQVTTFTLGTASHVQSMAVSHWPSLDQQVYEAVVHHPHIKQSQVHFKTDNGTVTIEGSVETYFEKQMAQEALRKIDGIESIKNQLEVNWS